MLTCSVVQPLYLRASSDDLVQADSTSRTTQSYRSLLDSVITSVKPGKFRIRLTASLSRLILPSLRSTEAIAVMIRNYACTLTSYGVCSTWTVIRTQVQVTTAVERKFDLFKDVPTCQLRFGSAEGGAYVPPQHRTQPRHRTGFQRTTFPHVTAEDSLRTQKRTYLGRKLDRTRSCSDCRSQHGSTTGGTNW